MKKFTIVFLVFLLTLPLSLHSQEDKNWDREIKKAEELYNKQKYDESIIIFREIILTSEDKVLKRESYFWIAKAYMGADKLEQAEENLEYYLREFSANGLNYPEAIYQKGRLLFLQEQYQSAIEQFDAFKKNYKDHKLVSNAFYWIGECLYALGQYDDSAFYFHIILTKYPASIKREASHYKIRLIEHKKSELALQNLLKWSQEQYLSSLNQFRIKEKTLKEALKQYKNSGTGISEGDKEKMNNLEDEIVSLQSKIRVYEEQLKLLKSDKDEDYLTKLEQLELKEQLLKNKEEALKILEEELRKKEKSLE